MVAERSRKRPALGGDDRPDDGSLGRERFTLHGPEGVQRLREALDDGNVVRVWVKDANGRTLLEIPWLLGIRGGGRLPPIIAAVTALASSSSSLTIELAREAAWPLSG